MTTRRIARMLAAAAAVASLATGGLLAGAGPAAAASVHRLDTGIVDDYDGGCRIRTTVTYYPGSDTAQMTTTITSPYLFAACRANATLSVHTSNNVYQSAVQYAMACGVWDTTCASTRTWTNTYYNATPGLRAAYPDPTAREEAVRSVSVSFMKA